MEILDNDLENLDAEEGQQVPRILLIFSLALFFMFSSVFKKMRLYFSIKGLSADERFFRLDWINPSGDMFDQLITAVILFIGCIASLILAIKYKGKIKSKKEKLILFSPFCLLIIHLILQFLSTEILYSLI